MKGDVMHRILLFLLFTNLWVGKLLSLIAPSLNETVLDAMMAEKHKKFAMSIEEAIKVVKAHKSKAQTDWEYNSNCRVTIPKTDGHCVVNNESKFCFTERIDYNYTSNAEIGKFPKYLEIVQRFPRCWSHIGPLLCAAYYRPCSMRPFIDNRAEGRILKVGEALQVFPTKFCSAARKACEFVIELGLWPKFLDCHDELDAKFVNVEVAVNDIANATKTFFNRDCKMKYAGAPSKVPLFQCLWPLVNQSSSEKIDAVPLIDNCYMPCRSPLIENLQSFNNYQNLNFAFVIVLAFVFSIIAVYFCFFSQVYLESYEVFVITQSLLCISVYYNLWAFLSIDFFDWLVDSAVCTDNGRIRSFIPFITLNKLSFLKNLFSLCAIEAFTFHSSLICAYIWLSCFFLHHCFSKSFHLADYPLRMSSPSNNFHTNQSAFISARRLLLLTVYSFGMGFSLLNVLIFEIPVDGISRVCHFAARYDGFHHSFISYTPILIINAIVVISICLAYFTNRGHTSSKSVSLTAVSLRLPSIEDTEAGKLHNEKTSSTSYSSSRFVVNGCQQPLISSKDVLLTTPNDSAGSQCGKLRNFNNTDKCKLINSSLVCNSHFLAILFANLAFCCFSLYTQFVLFVGSNTEVNVVMKSLNCSLKSVSPFLSNHANMFQWTKTDYWQVDMIEHTTNPYERKINLKGLLAPSCYFEYMTESYLWISSAFMLFNPSLPFIAISLWFFFVVFCDKKRLIYLRKVRKNLFLWQKTISISKSSSLVSLSDVNATHNLSEKFKSNYKDNTSSSLINNKENISLPGNLEERNSLLSNGTNNNHFSTPSVPLFSTPSVFLNSTPLPQFLSPFPLQYNNFQATSGLNNLPVGAPFLPPQPFNYNVNPYANLSVSANNLPMLYSGAMTPSFGFPLPAPGTGSISQTKSDPVDKESKVRKLDLEQQLKKHKVERILAQKSGFLMAKQYAFQKYQEELEQKQQNAFLQQQQKVPFSLYDLSEIGSPIKKNPNLLSDTASLNSSATFNMTSVSQQPTVIPTIDPDVINAVYSCGYKQGAMQEQQRMEQRISELTKSIATAIIVIQQMSDQKQKEVIKKNEEDENIVNTTTTYSSSNDFETATIPMIFGAEGQRIMREFSMQSENVNANVINCQESECKCQHHNDCSNNNEVSGADDVNNEFSDEDDITNSNDEKDRTIDDAETNDESGSECIRHSDEFNSDMEDLEEEIFYNNQIDLLKQQKLIDSDDIKEDVNVGLASAQKP